MVGSVPGVVLISGDRAAVSVVTRQVHSKEGEQEVPVRSVVVLPVVTPKPEGPMAAVAVAAAATSPAAPVQMASSSCGSTSDEDLRAY